MKTFGWEPKLIEKKEVVNKTSGDTLFEGLLTSCLLSAY